MARIQEYSKAEANKAKRFGPGDLIRTPKGKLLGVKACVSKHFDKVGYTRTLYLLQPEGNDKLCFWGPVDNYPKFRR